MGRGDPSSAALQAATDNQPNQQEISTEMALSKANPVAFLTDGLTIQALKLRHWRPVAS